MSKWKFFNFRPLFFVFTLLVVGILCANCLITNLELFLAIFLLVLFLLLFYCIKLKSIIIFIVGLTSLVIGIAGYFFEMKKVEKYQDIPVGSEVSGTIDSVEITGSGRYFTLIDLKINGSDIKTNCTVRLHENEILENYNVGDKINFIAESVYTYEFYGEEIPNSSRIKKNIRHRITTSEVIKIGKDKSLKIILQERIKENISLGLDADKTNLMYSALFGDDTELNPMTKDSFTTSGVAHLLAVSGLNVSLIAIILTGILKIFKCNKHIKFIITVVFLFAYCYLCGWSASIVRATIMAVVMIGAPLLLCEYDPLSSLSFSGIVILLIRPSDLFDVSFLLSFMCILGIIMFYPYVTKMLNKVHFNNIVSQVFTVSVITNISTMMIMIYYFKKVSFIGIVSNIFILQLFTVVFCIVFIVSIISLIAPFVCYFLEIISPLINIVTMLSNYFASIATSLVTIKVSYLSIIIFAILLFFLSKYNVKNFVWKSLSVNAITILLILELVINSKVIT